MSPGSRIPDLEPRPLAHCFDCGEDVHARQTWKNTPLVRRYREVGMIGKYRQQYLYTCPYTSRRRSSLVVEPYVLPAAAAVEWSDVGARIGARKRPLESATMAKIAAGLEMIARGPTVLQVNHSGQGVGPDAGHPHRTGRRWDRLPAVRGADRRQQTDPHTVRDLRGGPG